MGRRPNNTGSICIEKATNKYRAAISINGKRVVKRFDTEEEAQRWLTITQADIYQGKFKDVTKITFLELADKYMELCCADLRPTSKFLYYKWLGKLKPIYNIKVQTLNKFHIYQCINNLNVCNSTKTQVRNLARRILNQAVEMDIVQKNVAENVKIKQKPTATPTQRVNIFTDEEIHKILGVAKTISKKRDYYLFILTAVLTGMRIGEILGLQYHNIGNGTIEVDSAIVCLEGRRLETPPKTDAGARILPVPPRLTDMLKTYKREGMLPTDYIFHTRTRLPWSQTNIEYVWKQILELAGVPYRTFHKLRHHHASILIENNVSIPEVSKRLGHSNPAITVRIYSHALMDQDKKIVDKVNEAFPLLKD